jgi:hypothetical protein
MTEDEAKTKWCPMVRHEGEEHGSFNRGGISDPINSFGIAKGYGCGCIASGCMIWREDLTREEAQNGYQAKSGHCGLGGLP